jgi:transposase
VWAADLLALADLMFGLWHPFRAGAIDRALLQAALVPIQAAMRTIRERGVRRYDQAQGLRDELLTLWPALGTFALVDGVEPTNNAAERALRPAVLWRKKRFGAQRQAGTTFVERILTVRATCAQPGRHLLTFLTEAVWAHWARQPAPKLVLPS